MSSYKKISAQAVSLICAVTMIGSNLSVMPCMAEEVTENEEVTDNTVLNPNIEMIMLYGNGMGAVSTEDKKNPLAQNPTFFYGYKDSTTESYANKYSAFTFMALDDTYQKGDVNLDGKIGISDIVMLQKWISGVGDLTCRQNADLNEDGKINVFDCVMLKRNVMKNMQSDKIIDYSILEKQWIRESSRTHTMTEQAYFAKSLDEFKGIIEKYELCENVSKCSCGYHDVENCIPEKIDKEFFKDKAAVVIYSSYGSSDKFIVVDKIERKQNCLIVYTTTKKSTMPTPDMAYHKLILAVDHDMLQDVNEVLYKNTSSAYDVLNENEYEETFRWYSEWLNLKEQK